MTNPNGFELLVSCQKRIDKLKDQENEATLQLAIYSAWLHMNPDDAEFKTIHKNCLSWYIEITGELVDAHKDLDRAVDCWLDEVSNFTVVEIASYMPVLWQGFRKALLQKFGAELMLECKRLLTTYRHEIGQRIEAGDWTAAQAIVQNINNIVVALEAHENDSKINPGVSDVRQPV